MNGFIKGQKKVTIATHTGNQEQQELAVRVTKVSACTHSKFGRQR